MNILKSTINEYFSDQHGCEVDEVEFFKNQAHVNVNCGRTTRKYLFHRFTFPVFLTTEEENLFRDIIEVKRYKTSKGIVHVLITRLFYEPKCWFKSELKFRNGLLIFKNSEHKLILRYEGSTTINGYYVLRMEDLKNTKNEFGVKVITNDVLRTGIVHTDLVSWTSFPKDCFVFEKSRLVNETKYGRHKIKKFSFYDLDWINQLKTEHPTLIFGYVVAPSNDSFYFSKRDYDYFEYFGLFLDERLKAKDLKVAQAVIHERILASKLEEIDEVYIMDEKVDYSKQIGRYQLVVKDVSLNLKVKFNKNKKHPARFVPVSVKAKYDRTRPEVFEEYPEFIESIVEKSSSF